MKNPTDWKYVKLRELIVESDEMNSNEKKLSVYTVSNKYGLIPSETFFDKIVYGSDISKYKLVKTNFFAFNPHRVNVGSIALNTGKIGLVSPAYCVFKIKDENEFLPEFLFYLLRSQKYRHLIKRYSDQGGIRFNLTFSSLSKFLVPLPSPLEQHRIVEFFSTIEEALNKVEDTVLKTERLKKGLIRKLLTEGIGHNEFKQTKIGRIPKNWQVMRLEDVAELRSGGTPRRQQPMYWNGSIPWLKSGELNDGEVNAAEERITVQGLKKSNAKIFPKGTLLFALYGKGTVSKTAILGIDAATNQAVCAIIPRNNLFDPKFLQYYLIFSRHKLLTQFVNPSTDVGRTNIYLGALRLFSIPLPFIPEQRRIADILSAVDHKLKLERERKEKIKHIKRGLMNALLTGKRRVKVAM